MMTIILGAFIHLNHRIYSNHITNILLEPRVLCNLFRLEHGGIFKHFDEDAL